MRIIMLKFLRERAMTSHPELKASVELYFKAISLYPYTGKYYMLISRKCGMIDFSYNFLI